MSGDTPRTEAPARVRTRRGWALAVAGLTASVTLAGCSSSPVPGPAEPGTPDGQATAKGLTVSGEWPLTGLPFRGRAPQHPVMVVKIDNSTSSRPQVGVGRADLVTEELVEGGSTRLAVFFYQHAPRLVGPVRSMRATDIGIVQPAKAVLVASGGAPPTVARIRAAGITTFTEGAPGYRRDSSRPAPYNLFMDLARLAKGVKARDTVPSYLPFGPASSLPRGKPAAGLAATFSGSHTTRWTYQGGTYVDPASNASAGDRFRPDNVLVLRVQVGDAGYRDPAGNPVPETRFTGSGEALLFHGGRVVRGTWSKTLSSTISLRTASGELTIPSGHTWIELVPRDGGSVTISK